MYKLKKSQIIYLPFKRLADIIFSLLGIIILLPLMGVVAIITKCTSKGPVIFKQPRPGKNEKIFTMLKFRSMKADAPQIPPEKMTVKEQTNMTTKWGSFIRKTSIDEIPQLFNILAGHMSFIGPRPGQIYEQEKELMDARRSYIPSAYEVKPGLSGYAQIHLKRAHDVNQKAYYDHQYVLRMSPIFDIKIFFYSVLVVFGFAKGR